MNYRDYVMEKTDNIISSMKSAEENEKLLLLAKFEKQCYGNGISEKDLHLLLDIIRNEESELVRGFGLRILYHQPNEGWPISFTARDMIKQAISEILDNDENGFDGIIAAEMIQIDQYMRWLSNKPRMR